MAPVEKNRKIMEWTNGQNNLKIFSCHNKEKKKREYARNQRKSRNLLKYSLF